MLFVHELMVYILSVAVTVGSLGLPQEEAAAFPHGAWTVETLAGTGSHGAVDGRPAQFNLPGALFEGTDGTLWVADTYNNLLRIIDGDGGVYRVAGTVLSNDIFGFPRGTHRDGALSEARFNRPTGGVMDAQGRVFIADSRNHAIRVIVDGRVFTFAGGAGYGHADGPASEARFHLPTALAIGPCGGLFVADTVNHVIRVIGTDGNVTTVAGVPGADGYFCEETGVALFNAPMGLAVDAHGRIFVADSGNHLIRVIENGAVRTLAGARIFPADVDWTDPEGADFDEEPLGGFADGQAALFNQPVGLALWGDVLLVADSVNHRVRGVLPCGTAFTVAGTGEPGHADGTGEFHFPHGILVRNGRLYVADAGNNSIRILTPTEYSQ